MCWGDTKLGGQKGAREYVSQAWRGRGSPSSRAVKLIGIGQFELAGLVKFCPLLPNLTSESSLSSIYPFSDKTHSNEVFSLKHSDLQTVSELTSIVSARSKVSPRLRFFGHHQWRVFHDCPLPSSARPPSREHQGSCYVDSLLVSRCRYRERKGPLVAEWAIFRTASRAAHDCHKSTIRNMQRHSPGLHRQRPPNPPHRSRQRPTHHRKPVSSHACHPHGFPTPSSSASTNPPAHYTSSRPASSVRSSRLRSPAP